MFISREIYQPVRYLPWPTNFRLGCLSFLTSYRGAERWIGHILSRYFTLTDNSEMFTQCFLPGLHGDELDRFYRDDDHNNKNEMKCSRHPSHQSCTETNWRYSLKIFLLWTIILKCIHNSSHQACTVTNWTPQEVKTAMFTAKLTAWIGTRWVENHDNDNRTGTILGWNQ